MDLDEFEREARAAKWAQIVAAQSRDKDRMAEISAIDSNRAVRASEALTYLSDLRSSHDGASFAQAMEKWCRRPGFEGFVGPNGQMFLKQVLGAGDGDEAAELLADALTAPTTDEEAVAKLQAFLDFIERVKSNGHPGPARTPFLLSFFWSLQDSDRWPVAWSSAVKMLEALGWLLTDDGHAHNYIAFSDLVRSLGEPTSVAHALFWFNKHRFVGLSPSLIDRCAHAWELADTVDDSGEYPDEATERAAEANTHALIDEVWMAASGLHAEVATAIGREVKIKYIKPLVGSTYRWWGWAGWQVKGGGPSLRVWVSRDGVLIGLHPSWYRKGWHREAGQIATEMLPDGYELFRLYDDDAGRAKSTGSVHDDHEFMVGRLYPETSALDREDLADDIIRAAGDLQPMVDRLLVAGEGASTKPDEPSPETSAPNADELSQMVAEFLRSRGYPTPKDTQAKADRESLALVLARDELEIADPAALSPIINTGRYGGPGPQSTLNATLKALDVPGLERLFSLLDDVLWGDDDLSVRLDRALDPDTAFKGLGESVLMKALAIAHPEQIVPVFPYRGDMGKAKLMQLIGLQPPAAELSRGQKQVESNDAIREALEPHFPGDAWAQAQFLYWLRTRPDEGTGTTDEVGGLADELFLKRELLDEIIEMLEEKGQVIFYGPPGTGKTFVAQKLAEVIAGDPKRAPLVQFHPSTSYEDFFEGFRPETDASGNLSYRLVPGPLARIAQAAADAPAVKHVMVIDEINRANLPKVLGELLFLLEYRDQRVQTLYRPDDAFELPRNLYFIGTMNTADKSIALIDAALRRRFHFIPFFPHLEPHDAVLRSWLEANNSDAAWVADLVEHANGRLVEVLGGPHLQIGPSYFFSRDLDEAMVRRIWKYSIVPFIEDQLWGQTEAIHAFEYDEVKKSYQAAAGLEADAGSPPDDVEADPDPSAPALTEPPDPTPAP